MATPQPEGDRDVTSGSVPGWSTFREAMGLVLGRAQLRRSAVIALVVGTVLFCINQLDVVLRGDATWSVWVKAATTYLVPFCVANAGFLAGTRRPR